MDQSTCEMYDVRCMSSDYSKNEEQRLLSTAAFALFFVLNCINLTFEEAIEEQSDMVDVNETMISREGDVPWVSVIYWLFRSRYS